MIELKNIEFFQLRKLRVKRFSNGLKTAYEKRESNSETLSEKQARIKANAIRINEKLNKL